MSYFRRAWEKAGMALVAGICFALFSLAVPGFFTPGNLTDLLTAISTVGIVSCTMLFCLAAGDFDLSVGSTVALAGVLAALLLKAERGALVAVVVPLLAGGAIGVINGFVIARLGINALITTLATMQIVRGIAYLICDGSSVGISDAAFTQLGQMKLGIVQSPVAFLLLFFLVFGLLLHKTVFGRNTLAIGGNVQAARLAGIGVVRTKVAIFALQGLAAAFAGILLASRVSSGAPRSGEALELAAISSCVLGGVSLTGGVGTLSGMISGVLILGMVKNAMDLRGVPAFTQMVASGAILLAAVLLDRLKRGGR